MVYTEIGLNDFQKRIIQIKDTTSSDEFYNDTEELYNATFNEGYDYYREDLECDAEDMTDETLKIQFFILKREMQSRKFKVTREV